LEDNIIHCFRGSPFAYFKGPGSSFRLDGSIYELDEVRLLAPCTPSKIVCLGLNYRSHAEETKHPIPSEPLIFLKPSTAVVGPDDEVVLPRSSRRVDYEGELAVVIGRKAKDVPQNRAKEYVLGYACFNMFRNAISRGKTGNGHGLKVLIPSPRLAPGLRATLTRMT
jgi:2-keto-4-pentenoate hydratase/2-oxohepta-3-ene-1,7-dioic acid hydratase in catechol pathway